MLYRVHWRRMDAEKQKAFICWVSCSSAVQVLVHFYHVSSYASTVLGVVILFVCPSVCHTRTLLLCD